MAWDFAGNIGSEVSDAADSVITHVSATGPSGEIVRGLGLSAPINTGRFNGSDWEVAAAPDLTGAQYMAFTIEPDPGFGLELTSIAFSWQSSGGGPDAVAFASSLDGFGSVIGTPLTGLQGNNSNNLTLALPAGTFGSVSGPVTFRVYGYAATGAGGTAGFESTLANTYDLIINGFVVQPEPTNHVSDFRADSLSGTAIQLRWTEDLAGPQLPDGYLLLARSLTGPAFPGVADGTSLPDDPDLSDGEALVTLTRGDTGYLFTNLTLGTAYAFAIYPFTNPSSGINLDYKTDLTIPTDGATTPAGCDGLFFSEYVESASEKYLEIYNGTGDIVDLSQYQVRRYANGATSFGTIPLSGYLAAEDVIVLGNGAGSLFAEDVTSGNIDFNGNDALALLRVGTLDTLDVIGRIGDNPGTAWASASWTTEDQVLVRRAAVRSGVVINPLAGFPTLEDEWTGFTDLINDNGLGNHDASSGCASGATCTVPAVSTALVYDEVKTGSLTLSFTGGAGADRYLVVISADPGAQPAPTDGVIYGPGDSYGGTGTVLSFDGSTSGIVAGDLTPNTTYHLTIFSYTSVNCENGPVYNAVALTGSQATLADNPTALFAGDLMIIGHDNNIGNGGDDRLVLVALRDLGEGTSFTLTNAVYEVGDAANVRSGRWFDAGGSAGGTNIASQRLTLYDAVPVGSIICIDLPVGINLLIEQIAINGTPLAPVTDFDVDDVGSGGLQVNAAEAAPDPLFVMQGEWDYSSGTHGSFDGQVLSGIMVGGAWWDVTDDLSALSTATDRRRSRIPPEITCLSIQVALTTGQTFGFYTPGAPHSGDQRALLVDITDVATHWTIGTGGSSADDTDPGLCTAGFAVSAPATAGQWLGGDPTDPTDWFTCGNWENFQVPDSTVDVVISTGATANLDIVTGTAQADLYGNRASCRHMSLENPATPLSAPGEVLYVHGDWDNIASPAELAFVEGGSTVEFRGEEDQALNATNGQAERFETLRVNKPSGELRLFGHVVTDPNGTLSLIQGLVDAGGHTLSVQQAFPGAIVAFGTQSYLYNGALARRVEPGVTYPFPVGESDDFQLATVTTDASFELATPLDSLNVQFNASIGTPAYTSNFDGTNFFADLLDGGTWTITPSGLLSTGSYEVALILLGSGNDANAGYRVMKTNPSGQFGLLGTFVGAGPAAGGVQATESGYLSFSDFGIGQNVGSTFPVEWLSFTATPQGDQVALRWETAQEVNHSHFVIERSADGASFQAIGERQGAGDASQITAYQFVDATPNQGVNYYRLKQVDLDGSFAYSERREVQLEATASLQWQAISPNPAQETLTVRWLAALNQTIQAELLTVQGQVVRSHIQHVQAGPGHLTFDLPDLPAGMYLYRLRAGEQVRQGKWVKQ
jgi:hypothetical protein